MNNSTAVLPTDLNRSGPDIPPTPVPAQPAEPAPRTTHHAALSSFPRATGETPRAFTAFTAYFTLSRARPLQAVADQLDEHLSTVKKWSVRHQWSERISAFNAGLLQHQAEVQLDLHHEHAADWARRTIECREQEWETAQKLRAAAQCFLETIGDQELGKMTLGQASRALHIAGRLARQALSHGQLPETAPRAPIQQEIEAALKKAFGSPNPQTDN